MKKSTLLLILGIALILFVCIADTVISGNYIDVSYGAEFGIVEYLYMIVGCLLFFAGIVCIVLSRRLAKKEKRAQ